MFKHYLIAFLIAMMPMVELRLAIPYTQATGIPIITAYIICILGNMLPVPFIYLFARKLLLWGKNRRIIGPIFSKILEKGERAGQKMLSKTGRGTFVALFLFVAIPLPGTGAWTGTLAASILDFKFKPTILAVMSGVFLAGIIMLLASIGLFHFILP